MLTWSLPALIALHVAAVFYHMTKRDEVPLRMLRPSESPKVAIPGNILWLAIMAVFGLYLGIPDFWTKTAAPAAAVQPSDEPLPVPSTEPDAASAGPEPTETAAGAQVAQSCDWTVEPGSRLGFTAHYGGDPVNGTFRKWQTKIKFCADDLPHAAINASISLASAATGDPDRDENLHGASFFDTARFAQARFTATGFKLLGPGRYAASGNLSLHGVNRPVRVVFGLVQSGAKVTAQGSTTLSRLAFGVGSEEWAATDQIPDPVTVQFTIRARRAN